MNTVIKSIAGAGMAVAMAFAAAPAAHAGDFNGDTMIRLGATVVLPDEEADVFAGATPLPTADADISTEVIPSLTITYFLNPNLALELFCCFSKHEIEGKGSIEGVDLGDTWIFPPALTLQYHFNAGSMKPYVGAGVQYIAFFNESTAPGLGNSQLEIDNAFGFTLQAGVDIPVSDGWYINADVKKTWLNTDAQWSNGVNADVDVDPWLFTVGGGFRFNLSDVIGGQ